jgi:fatty-acyl-CoA synthase
MTPATIGELYDRAVLHGGRRIAISDGDRRLTYAELGENAARLAAALQQLGIGPGARVAFLMANCAEYVFCEYAVAKVGATRVPLAVLLANDDLAYILNFARCDVVIYHEKLAARLLQIAPALETVRTYICVGDGPAAEEHLTLRSLLTSQAPPMAPVAIASEDIASIYFTGGTTGRPKGVMLSHRSWYYTYYAEMLEFGIADHETFVFVTPMTHASGCLLLPVLLRQGRCVVLDHFDPDLLLGAIQKERATATLVVPTMLYALLDHPARGDYDLSSLRNVLYGASAIAPERLKQALRLFGPIFTQFFGQTEAPMVLTALPRDAHLDPGEDEAETLMSAGRAAYQAQVRLLDDDGRDAAPGELGEVVARSLNMMSGYLDNPEATAATIRDGWLHTGDIARMGASGLITIVDRKKDMIVSGGFNVYPREVEDALSEHPAVRQAAVIGVPHEKWGEEVKAIVVLRPGAQADERGLIDFVKARKGSLMAPKSVEFWDAIPLTNLGKIDKKAMRARFWSGQQRRV